MLIKREQILDTLTKVILMSIAVLPLYTLFIKDTALPMGELAHEWTWLYKSAFIALPVYGCMLAFQLKRSTRLLPLIVSMVLIVSGLAELILAIKQLYGIETSNHSLYRFTGTFLNPGPFSGYIAMIMPICLHVWLTYKETLNGYISLGVICLSLIILPAGMSRSAWIASAVSMLCVYCMHTPQIWQKGKLWIVKDKKRKYYIGAIIIIVALLGAGAYLLKKDSANGRLFMWKIGINAIAEKPWNGYGTTGFAAAYSHAQENYFAAGNYTAQEEHVAGTPDYAFNEYLQIGIEYGIPVLLITLFFTGIALWYVIKRKEYGIAGAFISVAIFSFSSYPLQLPGFVAAIAILFTVPFTLALSALKERVSYSITGRLLFPITTLCVFIYLSHDSIHKFHEWEKRHTSCSEWRSIRSLYQMEAYESAIREYKAQHQTMKWNYTFLFEYGHALHKKELYEESNEILHEAEKLCGDPMILNIMGKNHQGMKEFESAEKAFIRSTNRLPGRLYPYYLLMKLYHEPDFHQSEKLYATANTVLTKEPKVHSKAVEEMRKEAREIIKIEK